MNNSKKQPPDNEVWYTTNDGRPIETPRISGILLSNEFHNGKGILVFNSPVTAITAKAFEGQGTLVTVELPDSVARIDKHAFCNCKLLRSITFGRSLSFIDECAFENSPGCDRFEYRGTMEDWCGMKFENQYSNPLSIASTMYIDGARLEGTVVIPDTVKEINSYAFCRCRDVMEFVIPESVTSIGDFAFCGSLSLSRVVIPDSVTSVGGFAFSRCPRLEEIRIPDGLESITCGMFDGCLALKKHCHPQIRQRYRDDGFFRLHPHSEHNAS